MTTTTVTWNDLKHKAIQAFNGELPNATTEQDIIDAFETEPIATMQALDQVTIDYAAGKLRSGWAIWRKRCTTATTTSSASVQLNDAAEKQKQLRIAENWIRHAGGNTDRETELLSELYDPDLGKLRHWPETQPQILTLWHTERPRFERNDAQAIERMAHQATTLKALRKQAPRSKCRFCERTHRSDTDACAEHRHLLADDYRVSDEVERAHLAYLEQLKPESDEGETT